MNASRSPLCSINTVAQWVFLCKTSYLYLYPGTESLSTCQEQQRRHVHQNASFLASSSSSFSLCRSHYFQVFAAPPFPLPRFWHSKGPSLPSPSPSPGHHHHLPSHAALIPTPVFSHANKTAPPNVDVNHPLSRKTLLSKREQEATGKESKKKKRRWTKKKPRTWLARLH